MMHRFWITFTKLALFILICWSCNLSLKTELRMSDLKQFNWLAGHTVQAISSYTCANEYGQWKRQQFRKKYQIVKSEKYEKKLCLQASNLAPKWIPGIWQSNWPLVRRGVVIVVLFWNKHAVDRQIRPWTLKWTIRRD